MTVRGQNVVSGSLWLAFSSCSSPLAEILKNRYYFSMVSVRGGTSIRKSPKIIKVELCCAQRTTVAGCGSTLHFSSILKLESSHEAS